MDIYDESHLLRQTSDQIFISDNTHESRMSADDENEIIFSPSESDMNILQRTSNTSVSMNTSVNK